MEHKESINSVSDTLSPEWQSWLWKFNLVAGLLHLVQGLIQLILGLTVDSFNKFKLPLRIIYLKSIETPEGGEYLDAVAKDWGDVKVAPLVAIFFLLSAFAHFTVLYMSDQYFAQLARGTNYFRWWEYAFSSSFMIVLIAQFFGVYDIASLLLIFSSNFATQFMGLLMEQINDLKREDAEINWTPFIVGCITGFSPWVAIFFYFLGSGPSSEIPGFVYGILISYFIFFNTFPLNMIFQYKKWSYWKDYLFGEQVYIILSLVAKSFLGWLVFGGVNQPNKYTDS